LFAKIFVSAPDLFSVLLFISAHLHLLVPHSVLATGSGACTPGYFCTGGVDRVACPAGAFSAAGATVCTLCGANTFQVNGGRLMRAMTGTNNSNHVNHHAFVPYFKEHTV
jgi:hypothetical protein